MTLANFLPLLANHLWQSTIFAAAAGTLILALRRNHARTRFWIWWVVSVKFLIPFSLLVAAGTQLHSASRREPQPSPAPLLIMEQLTEPVASDSRPAVVPAVTPALDPVPILFLTAWAVGSGALLVRWGIRWSRARVKVGRGEPTREAQVLRRLEHETGMRRQTAIVSSTAALEPSAVGLFRSVLVWPSGLSPQLDDRQLEAVLLHELAHIRRRDNLTSSVHMVVETLFWFHPLVWWIGARLVCERENACDQEVLSQGGVPQAYAESILKVCEFCLQSPLMCAAGVTGSNLSRRVEDIMKNQRSHRLNRVRILLLSAATIAALVIPIAAGVVQASERHAQSALAREIEFTARALVSPISVPVPVPTPVPVPSPVAAAQAPREVFDIISIRPADPTAGPIGGGARGGGGGGQRGGGGGGAPGPCTGGVQLSAGRLVIRNVTLYRLVTFAYGMNCRLSTEQALLTGGPEWWNSVAYDVQATIPEGTPKYTMQQLVSGAAPRLQAMLQNMLADRFGLALHSNTKEIPVYNLVMVKTGRVKLSEDQTPTPQGLPRGGFSIGVDPPNGKVTISGSGIPMQTIIDFIQGGVGRMVVDKVEPKGLYDIPEITLDVGPFDISPGAVTVWPEIISQLGMKLDPTKGNVQALVIDRAQKPSEN